jgi:hypothetical protein
MMPVALMGSEGTSPRGATIPPNEMQCAHLPGIHIEPKLIISLAIFSA